MKHKSLLESNIFISAFSYNREAAKFLLETILGANKPLSSYQFTIKDIKLCKSGFTRSDGLPDQSIIIFAEDEAGHSYDFALLIADEKYFSKQARVHSSYLTAYGRYAENENVEDYILMFTPKTLPGFELPLAIINWKVIETDEILEDTDHILIINCERDTRTYSRFHDVIHDLRQHNLEEMYTFELRQAFLEVLDQHS